MSVITVWTTTFRNMPALSLNTCLFHDFLLLAHFQETQEKNIKMSLYTIYKY